MMKQCHLLSTIAMVLLIVGGLNWGLIGLFKWDVVASIFGEMSMPSRVVYSLVGLAAVWKIGCWCKCCSSSCSKSK